MRLCGDAAVWVEELVYGDADAAQRARDQFTRAERGAVGSIPVADIEVIVDALVENVALLDQDDVELLVRCVRRSARSSIDPERLIGLWQVLGARHRYLLMSVLVEHDDVPSAFIAQAIVTLDRAGYVWTRVPDGRRAPDVIASVLAEEVSDDLRMALFEKVIPGQTPAAAEEDEESAVHALLHEGDDGSQLDRLEREYRVVTLLERLRHASPSAAEALRVWQASVWPRARAGAVAAARRLQVEVDPGALEEALRCAETRRAMLRAFAGDARALAWSTPELVAEGMVADYFTREDWELACPPCTVVARASDGDDATLLALQAGGVIHLVRVPDVSPEDATHVVLATDTLPSDWTHALSPADAG